MFVGALAAHGGLLVRGGSDPHKLFGFRPFNESDTWQADIVRILHDGTRLPVDDGMWDELVGTSKLRRPGRTRHAAAGADATIDFLDKALAWAVDHVSDDPDTVALEAVVTVTRNTRGPEIIVLRHEIGRRR